MKKMLFCIFLLLISSVCYSNEPEDDLDKTSLRELSQIQLNSIDNKKTPQPKVEQAVTEKDPEFWQKKLESPLLEQAKQEKEAKEKNKELAAKEKKSILHKIVFYIPNRLVDLTDIFSFKLGFGPEASLVLSFTKWFEFGGSYGDNYFIENGYNRQYGGGYHGGHEASVGWANWSENYTDYTFGYTKPYVFNKRENSVIPSPSEEVYKDGILDFWKIGVHVGWLANVGLEIHPVAIANFMTGFVFIRLTDTEEF
jgi:hypothetical protein